MDEATSKAADHRPELFELGSAVNGNRAMSHAHRALIVENVTSGLQIMFSAFSANRNLMSEYTTNIFRSRRVLIEAHAQKLGLSEEVRENLQDEVELDCLIQRCESNRQVIAINSALADFNQGFVNLLKTLLEINKEKMAFNEHELQGNQQLLESGIDTEKLAPLQQDLVDRLTDLAPKVEENTNALEDGFEASRINREAMAAMRVSVEDEMAEINLMWERIEAEQALSSGLMAGAEVDKALGP